MWRGWPRSSLDSRLPYLPFFCYQTPSGQGDQLVYIDLTRGYIGPCLSETCLATEDGITIWCHLWAIAGTTSLTALHWLVNSGVSVNFTGTRNRTIWRHLWVITSTTPMTAQCTLAGHLRGGNVNIPGTIWCNLLEITGTTPSTALHWLVNSEEVLTFNRD